MPKLDPTECSLKCVADGGAPGPAAAYKTPAAAQQRNDGQPVNEQVKGNTAMTPINSGFETAYRGTPLEAIKRDNERHLANVMSRLTSEAEEYSRHGRDAYAHERHAEALAVMQAMTAYQRSIERAQRQHAREHEVEARHGR